MVALVLAGGAAQAQSLRVAGTAGYVSEWELSGEATQTVSEATKEYFGPLTIKHVGLCSHDRSLEEFRRNQISDIWVRIVIQNPSDASVFGHSVYIRREIVQLLVSWIYAML